MLSFLFNLRIQALSPNTYEVSLVKRKYFSIKPAGRPTLTFIKTLLPGLVSHWLAWVVAVPHKHLSRFRARLSEPAGEWFPGDLETHRFPDAVPVKRRATCRRTRQLVPGQGQDRSVLTFCIRERDGHPIKGRGLPEDGPVPDGCDLSHRHFGSWPAPRGICTVGSS